CSTGTVMNCAHVPSGRFHWPFQTQTRWPTRSPGTPDPTFSMTPPPSLWGIMRDASIGRDPPRALTSEGLTPEVLSPTRTWRGPAAWGPGVSPTTRTSRAGPVLSYQAARIVALPPNLQATIIDHDRGPSMLSPHYSLGVVMHPWKDAERLAGDGSGDFSTSQR